ncbi:hypothetical protein BGZ65_012552 [Modicella reniformis]|uniref:Uncharacterized protein n=1 Tax=Modicella reniformis TaxID=1440133 RepID=A0A9P6IM64_9FUNG|nr:hypothetical protein BGZ65_012552 [Modicella reniformis]
MVIGTSEVAGTTTNNQTTSRQQDRTLGNENNSVSNNVNSNNSNNSNSNNSNSNGNGNVNGNNNNSSSGSGGQESFQLQPQRLQLLDPKILLLTFGPDLEKMDLQLFLNDSAERSRILRLEFEGMRDELLMFRDNVFFPTN